MVDGLPSGRYRVHEYRVDAASGNAFARREAIEQELEQAIVEGRAAARDYLAKRWSAAEMAQLKGGGGDKGARLRQLPANRQQEFREAMALQNEAGQRKAREINATAPLRGKALPEVEISGSHSWQVDVPPYGVVLLEAERRN